MAKRAGGSRSRKKKKEGTLFELLAKVAPLSHQKIKAKFDALFAQMAKADAAADSQVIKQLRKKENDLLRTLFELINPHLAGPVPTARQIEQDIFLNQYGDYPAEVPYSVGWYLFPVTIQAILDAADVPLLGGWCKANNRRARLIIDIGNMWDSRIRYEFAALKRKKTGGLQRPRGISLFPSHYNETELEDAKDFVRRKFAKWKTRPPDRWHDRVREAFPALELDETDKDLVERLSPNPDLDEDTLALIEKKDHDVSSIRDIALELAARRCGCKPYRYTIRRLLQLKTVQ